MEVNELYTKILGIEEPWLIVGVQLDQMWSVVRVHLEHADGKQWKNPRCDRELAIHDHSEERR